ncbi:MAG: hypothetical protein C4524_03005, partial [Candidatus Zixiibacteriota bacterium]
MDLRLLEQERMRLEKAARAHRSAAPLFWELFPFFLALRQGGDPAVWVDFGSGLAGPFLRSITPDTLSRLTPRRLAELDAILGAWAPDLEGAHQIPALRFALLLERARRYLWAGDKDQALELLLAHGSAWNPHAPTSGERSFRPHVWLRRETAAWDRFRVQAHRDQVTILAVILGADGRPGQGELL